MKGIKVISILLALISLQTPEARGQNDKPLRTIKIGEVTVTARRALTDIGTQKTRIDSAAVRDNITKSIADVLSQNSSIFIKSYGRATLSTASFRGTAPSHTQVMWNDMKLNNPMLGMVDFSLIPSYFIDDVTLYHGASSVGVTGGGLGGAITLGNRPPEEKGFSVRYIQGFSSFSTFDQFLRLAYGKGRFSGASRVFYADSKNDFTYTNYRKKIYTHDDAGEIADRRYPVEKNRNGSFKDFHVQQELYYRTENGDDLSFAAWYMDSRRGVPMLNVDYRKDSQSKNEQSEKTIRAVAGWDRPKENYHLDARGGYTYTDMQYLYLGDLGGGRLSEMIHSRSYVSTVFGKSGGDYYIGDKWLFSANAALHQHFVNSTDRAIITNDGKEAKIGYDQARLELSAFASVRYRPTGWLGVAANVRQELHGDQWSQAIPAGFIEVLLSKRWNVAVKASLARNYRYPTLNDLYFMPGGNPGLKPEKGFTYDAGIEFGIKDGPIDLKGEAALYDSRIDDWILWLPTFKGFWSPVNVKKVHSYGVELKGKLRVDMGAGWMLWFDANYTISNAVNHGDPVNWADRSIGKQLVYIPKHSNGVTGKLSWRSWIFTYKYNYYSRRFTTSSNETKTRIGLIGAYYMSDVSLEKLLSFRWVGVNFKVAVNNLFDEEYESVLSRPMAGRNYGFFIEIIPKFGKQGR